MVLYDLYYIIEQEGACDLENAYFNNNAPINFTEDKIVLKKFFDSMKKCKKAYDEFIKVGVKELYKEKVSQ